MPSGGQFCDLCLPEWVGVGHLLKSAWRSSDDTFFRVHCVTFPEAPCYSCDESWTLDFYPDGPSRSSSPSFLWTWPPRSQILFPDCSIHWTNWLQSPCVRLEGALQKAVPPGKLRRQEGPTHYCPFNIIPLPNISFLLFSPQRFRINSNKFS